MNQNLRIKLTKLTPKFPEAVVSSLPKQAESCQDAHAETARPACPYCGNTHIVKNGHKCGKQEYRCRDCGVLSYPPQTQLSPDHIRAENYGKKSYPIF